VIGKIKVFDSQTQAFGDAQTAAIQELDAQFWDAFHFTDHCHGFLVRQHVWESFGAAGTEDIG
jgi:hypothetical protein